MCLSLQCWIKGVCCHARLLRIVLVHTPKSARKPTAGRGKPFLLVSTLPPSPRSQRKEERAVTWGILGSQSCLGFPLPTAEFILVPEGTCFSEHRTEGLCSNSPIRQMRRARKGHSLSHFTMWTPLTFTCHRVQPRALRNLSGQSSDTFPLFFSLCSWNFMLYIVCRILHTPSWHAGPISLLSLHAKDPVFQPHWSNSSLPPHQAG